MLLLSRQSIEHGALVGPEIVGELRSRFDERFSVSEVLESTSAERAGGTENPLPRGLT